MFQMFHGMAPAAGPVRSGRPRAHCAANRPGFDGMSPIGSIPGSVALPAGTVAVPTWYGAGASGGAAPVGSGDR
ncbi:hypothetical protein, partial [Streptomyces massasporeus]|uniref:hypothetical protein n=1 Tax=Streptomyces massasporeus TaxID=67324 RepID=UPI00335C76E6